METLPAPIPPHRPNRNGWTAVRQRVFIEALADSGSVSQAALSAGMTRQAANWLRRHPAAHDFRTAWDAALAFAWQQVEAAALDRIINGEIEIIERDGVRITRHRPCNPRLLTHMLDRAVVVREKAEAAAVKARQPNQARVQQMRDEIRALAAGRATIATDSVDDDAPPPRPEDPISRAFRELQELTSGFVDQPGWEDDAENSEKVENLNDCGAPLSP